MLFTHRADPARTARIEKTAAEPPTFTVHHTDAKGKARAKSFKNAVEYRARDAALRFLLNTEQYIARPPQDGPIRWMTRFPHSYRGDLAVACHRATGALWCEDGNLRVVSIDRADIAAHDRGTTVANAVNIACGANGEAFLLEPIWERDAGQPRRVWSVKRVERATAAAAELHRAARSDAGTPIGSIVATADGRILVPHPSGAALLASDGSELATWQIAGTVEGEPVGGISEDGRYLGLAYGATLRIIELASGREEVIDSGFKTVSRLQITDDGVAYLSGFRYPSHGVYRVDGDSIDRVSDDVRATLSPDGRRLVEATAGTITERDLASAVERTAFLPLLGMAKHAQSVWSSPTTIVIATDAYTLAELDLAAF